MKEYIGQIGTRMQKKDDVKKNAFIWLILMTSAVGAQETKIDEWQNNTMDLCQEIDSYAEVSLPDELTYVVDISRHCYLSVERVSEMKTSALLVSMVTDREKKKRADELFQLVLKHKKASLQQSVKDVDRALNLISNQNMVAKGTRLKDYIKAMIEKCK